jgi:hypothetical protein
MNNMIKICIWLLGRIIGICICLPILCKYMIVAFLVCVVTNDFSDFNFKDKGEFIPWAFRAIFTGKTKIED